MGKYTMDDFKEGRVAIKNDMGLELIKFIAKCGFGYQKIDMEHSHFAYNILNKKLFCVDNVHCMPVQALSDFIEDEPKKGDRVIVWDTSKIDKKERIFLTKIYGAIYPIITVSESDEDSYKRGEKFDTEAYQYMESVVELTKRMFQMAKV